MAADLCDEQNYRNMNVVVTGSLGHISKPLTQELAQKGHAVKVISSNPDRQAVLEALGATAAIGSLEDAPFLTAAFAGPDAVYVEIFNALNGSSGHEQPGSASE